MLNITKTQRKDFKRHFISNAFLEIRFPLINFDWNTTELNFKEVTSTKLGLPVSRKSFSAQLRLNQPTNEKPQSIESYTETTGLIAQDKENTYSIQLQKDRIIFSTQKYGGFASFWSEVEKSLLIFKAEFKISHFVWLGVRKVNDIIVTNDNGFGYIGDGVNRQIFTPIKDGVFKPSAISRAFNRYELNDGNSNCIVDTQVAKLNQRDYSLKVDLDFNESCEPLAIEKANEVAFRLNEKLFEVFVWAISDEILQAMETT